MTKDEFTATMLLLGLRNMSKDEDYPAFHMKIQSGAEIKVYCKDCSAFFAAWKKDYKKVEDMLGLEAYQDYSYQIMFDHLIKLLEKSNDQR